MEFDGASDTDLTHRYLWGPAVDQILADEEVTSLASAGDVLWPLTDHLGTARDLAEYDAGTDTTSIANHRVYDSFGDLVSETNSAVDHLFGFTGRPWDEASELQYNLNRWYDPVTGQWMSEDPIGFAGQDPNLARYASNRPNIFVDPSGLREGHHFVPQSVFNALYKIKDFMSDEALKVFKGATVDPGLYNHGYDGWGLWATEVDEVWAGVKHSEYNAAVRQLLEAYQKDILKGKTLGLEQANEFLEFIKGNKCFTKAFEKKHAVAIATTRKWLGGFYRSIALAESIAESGAKLSKQEMKQAVRHLLNGDELPKGVAKKMSKFLDLADDVRKATMLGKLKGLTAKFGRYGVVLSILFSVQSFANGARGSEKFPDGGVVDGLSQLAFDSFFAEEVETYLFPAVTSACDALAKSLGGIDGRYGGQARRLREW